MRLGWNKAPAAHEMNCRFTTPRVIRFSSLSAVTPEDDCSDTLISSTLNAQKYLEEPEWDAGGALQGR